MYGPRVTGIGNYVQHLTDAMFARDRDAEFVLFLNPDVYQTFVPSNRRVTAVATGAPWYSWQEQLTLPWKLRRQHCDLVHFPNFNHPLGYRGKFVVTIHDLTPLQFPGPNQVRSKVRRAAYLAVLRSALRRAQAIIAVSQHTADEIKAYYPGCAQRLAVIYPGLSPGFLKNENCGIINPQLERWGIRKGYIFYAGVWRDHKNIPNLLRAFKIVRDKYGFAGQLVVGGDQRNADPQIARELKNFSPREVVAPGFILAQDLPDFYRAAAVTVIPSFKEGFGLVAIESLACKTPVAASQTTSVPEVLGRCGRYFPPDEPAVMAERIWELLQPDARADVLQQAPGLVQRFQWSRAAGETLSLYQRAVNSTA